MYTPLVYVSFLSLIPQITAQFNFPSPSIEYDAPPLESGVIAVTAFFTLITLIQLIIVLTYLIRGRSPHILPAVLVLSGMFFTLMSYVMYILELLTIYEFFNPLLPKKLIRRFDTASSIFTDWADPLIFVGVALIIRDRYRTYSQAPNTESNQKLIKSLPINLLMIPFYVLAALVVIFSSASIGVFQTLPTFNATRAAFNARRKVANGLLYTAETMYCLATVLLIPFAILVRSRIGKDKLMNWTLFGIIPVCFLRIIPQIVILVEEANTTKVRRNGPQLDLAAIITNASFYSIVFAFFCHIFLWTGLWYGPGEQPKSSYGYAGGQLPPAQFPGQWGYPQQGGYVQTVPSLQYPAPQGAQGQGQVQQHTLPHAHGQSQGPSVEQVSVEQVTQYPLPQTK